MWSRSGTAAGGVEVLPLLDTLWHYCGEARVTSSQNMRRIINIQAGKPALVEPKTTSRPC